MIELLLLHIAPLLLCLFAMGWYPCCTPCDCCDSGTASETMQVEFTGVADNCQCSECDDFNATFELSLNELNNCFWELEADEDAGVFPCDNKSDSSSGTNYICRMSLALNCVDDGSDGLVHQSFTVWNCGGLGQQESPWARLDEGTGKVACNEIRFEVQHLGANAEDHCNWDSATVDITAL